MLFLNFFETFIQLVVFEIRNEGIVFDIVTVFMKAKNLFQGIEMVLVKVTAGDLL